MRNEVVAAGKYSEVKLWGTGGNKFGHRTVRNVGRQCARRSYNRAVRNAGRLACRDAARPVGVEVFGPEIGEDCDSHVVAFEAVLFGRGWTVEDEARWQETEDRLWAQEDYSPDSYPV